MWLQSPGNDAFRAVGVSDLFHFPRLPNVLPRMWNKDGAFNILSLDVSVIAP